LPNSKPGKKSRLADSTTNRDPNGLLGSSHSTAHTETDLHSRHPQQALMIATQQAEPVEPVEPVEPLEPVEPVEEPVQELVQAVQELLNELAQLVPVEEPALDESPSAALPWAVLDDSFHAL